MINFKFHVINNKIFKWKLIILSIKAKHSAILVIVVMP